MGMLLKVFGLGVMLCFGSALAQEASEEPSDALGKAKARGKLVACSDPYNYPYAVQDADPPGFDVEIIREIAKLGGMSLGMSWVGHGESRRHVQGVPELHLEEKL